MVIALLAVGCSTKKAATTEKPALASDAIEGQKWQLIELNGKAVAATVNGKVPFLELLKEDGRYQASGGCNGLGGEYTLSAGNRIKFSRGMSTMMACPEMEVEQGLGRLFGLVDNYSVNGDVLSFSKARMAPVAKFKRMKEESATLEGTWELDYITGPRIAFAGLYPDKKPTLVFGSDAKKVSGNGSCNNFNTTVAINGSSIKFGVPAATRMACPGEGEPLFFKTLGQVSTFSVDESTLTLIMDDIAVMRFHKK